MATRVKATVLAGETRFFFFHAAALTIVAIAGFGFAALSGQADYGALPSTVYFHGIIFLVWCLLATAQPFLIGKRDWATHRRLGWVGAVLALLIGFSGIAVTISGVEAGRLAPPNLWLAMNILTVVPFLALVGVAIEMRRAPDWHRRLLASATIIVTAPAWARMLPMEQLGPLGLPVITAIVLTFILWGAIYDRRSRKRVHPAWGWGAAAVAVPGVLSIPLALTPPFATWANGFAPT